MSNHINVFNRVYERCEWGSNKDSLYKGSSGSGSDPNNAIPYICALKNIIHNSNGEIQQIVDLGCGDWRCGRAIYDDLMNDPVLNIEYMGYDAYIGVVNANRQRFPDYNFEHADIFNDREQLIGADMCVLKDVVQHWPNTDLNTMLQYICESRKYKYILLCNCCCQKYDDEDTYAGGFRGLNSHMSPLNKYPVQSLFKYASKEVCYIKTSPDLPDLHWQ
jgi:hypothetical protein